MTISRPISTVIIILSLAACSLGSLWHASNNAGGSAHTVRKSGVQLAKGLPSIEPVRYLPITEDQATALNTSQVPPDDVGPAALPFRAALTPDASARALKCLTEAIYYEAGSQDVSGQRAVAQVVLNRVRNAAFPASICGVVYQGAERTSGCQFTFTCDGSLSRPMSEAGFRKAHAIATAALKGSVFAPVGNATHYHADWVVPYWASSLIRATRIGAHIFYRWKGFWGQPAGFSQRYAGAEPVQSPAADQPVVTASSQTDLIANVNAPPIVIDRTVLVEDLQSKKLLSNRKEVAHQVLRADELRGVLLPALQKRPQILADAKQSGIASNSQDLLIGRSPSRKD